ARRLFGPSLHALRQVSLFAWVPLIMVWFGLGETSKVVFVAIAAFFPVLLNSAEGVAGIAREHLEVARVATFSRTQTFFRLILPSAMPSILTGVHLALVGAWGATLGAEYLMTSGPGIGTLLIDGQETSAMDVTLVGMLLAGLVGFGLHLAATRAEARLLRWRAPDPSADE
ncbi:MAG TPA: taurine ABC transporter permease, partial [Xanthomonadaceae bacterium]|nr:taurine ABC transporter permease [Xanthomonadaceae bacterium]